jgi:radical SAM superfamily enzyme YgiQ (UPF0313 family)
MNKILFLKPPNSSSRFTRSGSLYPPLGLCQLAAMFSKDEFSLLDAEADGMSDEQARVQIEKIDPRFAILTASSFNLNVIEKWARWFKGNDIIVIAGGPHPTLLPFDFFSKCPSVDYAVRGEGELILPHLLHALKNGRTIPEGACSERVTHGGIKAGRKHRMQDFTWHPFPTFDGLNLEKYWCPDAAHSPMITMMTARGCPNRCSFCSAPALHGRRLRGWSVTQVLNELQRLVVLGVKEISFLDDGFTSNRERAVEICKGMINEGLGLSWFCNARADRLDNSLAAIMSEAGCHQIYLGLESGSQQILYNVNKDLDLSTVRPTVDILRKNNVGVSAGFVIGLPGENDKTVEETIRFACELKPDRIQFSRFVPLPGSALGNIQSTGLSGEFHKGGSTRLEVWIREAYQRCSNDHWGAPSW